MYTFHTQNVDVLVNGKPIKQYAHNGKIFVESRHGVEYSIRLRNSSPWRVLAVCSVDGINVINGEAASPDDAGYIIDGNASYTVKGFRTSDESVNAFKFSKKADSYAAKNESTKKDTSNCGVIGAKFIYEKVDWNLVWGHSTVYHYPTSIHTPIQNQPFTPYWHGTKGSSAAMPSDNICRSFSAGNVVHDGCYLSSEEPIAAAAAPNFDMGTEFSKNKIKDKVTSENFERGTEALTFEIYYASREALEAMGIKVDKTASVSFPQAFPSKFCKPPR